MGCGLGVSNLAHFSGSCSMPFCGPFYELCSLFPQLQRIQNSPCVCYIWFIRVSFIPFYFLLITTPTYVLCSKFMFQSLYETRYRKARLASWIWRVFVAFEFVCYIVSAFSLLCCRTVQVSPGPNTLKLYICSPLGIGLV